ncbi:dual specificity protein phosphatase family protein [uncultured Desulfobacter sp.]|uniref:protein-tyrosine phosphatase family protein n=1 Tax=uncultured Desulfobacter sp. TaxID=240139 RepID=UPI0029F4ECE7|nr:dual specificity protein phosphatase family protein [uncultured Desulfobacter sp.]
MSYHLTWITRSLAVGRAPMSYAELDIIRENGIHAIVNLCAEFSDLHEIEEKAGFDVFHLPIWDEDVPEMAQMEDALAWMDEAIYLGKKVLVHCRHGIGRTGTFVTAYMIRKGLGLKAASKKLKRTQANPSTYSQWKLVKKYNKKSGMLKIRKPSLELKNKVDLGRFFSDYEALVDRIDQEAAGGRAKDDEILCGTGAHPCCKLPFTMPFIEVVYIHTRMGWQMKSDQRTAAVQQAMDALQAKDSACPFNCGDGCRIFDFRPVRCRTFMIDRFDQDNVQISNQLRELSGTVFLALSGKFLENGQFSFSMAETVSGKFVQAYFNFMAFNK